MSHTFRNPLLSRFNGKVTPTTRYKVGDGKKPGAIQDDIRAIQMAMMQAGYPIVGAANIGGNPNLPLAWTGVFDKNMETVVKKFQRDFLEPDTGVINDVFLKFLDNASAPSEVYFWTYNGIARTGQVPFYQMFDKETLSYPNTQAGWVAWNDELAARAGSDPASYESRRKAIQHHNFLANLFGWQIYDLATTKAVNLYAQAVTFPGGARPHETYRLLGEVEFHIADDTFAHLQSRTSIAFLEGGVTYKNVFDDLALIVCVPDPVPKKKRFPKLRKFFSKFKRN